MEKKMSGKKRRLLTIFDIIIIVVVIVIGGAVYLFSSSGGGTSAQSGTIRYSIEITEMEHGAADLISPGDTLKDNIKKYAIGSVVSVDTSQTVITYIDEGEGNYISAEPVGQRNALIVVEADCTTSDSDITVDSGFKVKCGESVAVSGPGYAGAGHIVAVERGD